MLPAETGGEVASRADSQGKEAAFYNFSYNLRQINPSNPRKCLLMSQIWLGAESNRRHEDFQSSALPTELPSRMKRGREYERASGPRKRKLDHLALQLATLAH
jgi:hypothetical protein